MKNFERVKHPDLRDGEVEYSDGACSTGSRLEEWVQYTLDRACSLEAGIREANSPNTKYRLRIKAGCFRSLAYEVKRVLSEENPLHATED